MHHIVLFSLYEFYENFSWKVFNDAMCTHEYVYLLIFLIRVFIRKMWDMIYAESVSPNLSHWVIGVFPSISRMKTFIFFIWVLKDYIRVHSSYFSHSVFEEFWHQRYICSNVHGDCYETLCPFEGIPLHKDTLLRRQLLEWIWPFIAHKSGPSLSRDNMGDGTGASKFWGPQFLWLLDKNSRKNIRN
jgi:hypothetical protein